MHTAPMEVASRDLHAGLGRAVEQANRVILGKEDRIRMALACLLAGGHLLIEDIPGVGKTTLAQTLARLLGLQFQRIQFTSDLLPADILGASVYERSTSTFTFHPGPVFAQLVLADEINRATPKTQSALLEAMEERQVTSDGQTRALPRPFFVIATQNPLDQVGTFPLPESQLDRFLMRIELGYPPRHAERALLKGQDRREILAALQPVLSPEALIQMQAAVRNTYTSDALLDYLQALVRCTRETTQFDAGLSPRAALGLKHAAQAWAFMAGRQGVIPEDVQAVLDAVVNHRLRAPELGESANARTPGRALLETVPIP